MQVIWSSGMSVDPNMQSIGGQEIDDDLVDAAAIFHGQFLFPQIERYTCTHQKSFLVYQGNLKDSAGTGVTHLIL